MPAPARPQDMKCGVGGHDHPLLDWKRWRRVVAASLDRVQPQPVGISESPKRHPTEQLPKWTGGSMFIPHPVPSGVRLLCMSFTST
jgi:hypothetical protein